MTTSIKKQYRIAETLGTLLWGRHQAVRLRDIILADAPQEAVVHFSGTTFATRAFADEWLQVERFLASRNIQVTREAIPDAVGQMFRHVSARLKQA